MFDSFAPIALSGAGGVKWGYIITPKAGWFIEMFIVDNP